MYSICMKAKHRMLFAKEANLTLAKEYAAEQFKEGPDFQTATIYDQTTKKEIERVRGGEWYVKEEERA